MATRNGHQNAADKREHARQICEQGLADLTQALEQGRSETLTAYLAAMARFHRYSFSNCMLIYSQRPNATQVAGYRTWQQLGRQVKRGEKGIVIFAPMQVRKRDAQAAGRDEADDKLVLFRAVYVFDLEQTEGEPLPQHAAVCGDPAEHLDHLKAVVADRGIALEYSDELAAEGVSSGGRITLRTGLSPAEAFCTLAHELAHEVLHHTDNGERPSRMVRETEAEAVAYVVSQAVGLDTNTACTDYIQLYRGDKDTLAASLDRIQKTASAILAAVLEEKPRSAFLRSAG